MSNSVFSAIKKLLQLLTPKEKATWLWLVGFTFIVSFLETITASVIVLFVQVLNEPEIAYKYTKYLHLTEELSPGRIIFYMAISLGVIYLIKNILAALELTLQNFFIQKVSYNFKNKMLNAYSKLNYGFFLTRNSSVYLRVLNGDIEQTFTAGMVAIASIISESIVFSVMMGMVIYMNPSLILYLAGISVFMGFVVYKLLLPYFYSWGTKIQEIELVSYKILIQFFHGFKEVVLFGKKDEFIKNYKKISKQRLKTVAMQLSVNSFPRIGIETLFVFLFVFAVAYLCMEHESPMQMVGILGGYLYAGFRLMPGLNRVINQLNIFKLVTPCIERTYDEYTTAISSECYSNVPELSFDKTIAFHGVDFKYLNTDKNALNNINLTIKKGESVGIVGETGSGKSTVMDLLLGLLKPSKGTILIDEKYFVNSIQWHKKVGYVPQSIYLIDDTIEANITFGEKQIDKVQLDYVIEAAQLNKLVASLPNGVKTIVGDRGVRLSGGERQRIAIARALYHNPEVLIFDEATSALDNETEKKLIQTINSVSKNRTVIMIAHRLSTLENCDRVIQLEAGKIKEYDYEIA